MSDFLHKRLKDIYAAYARGMIEDVADAFDDDVEFISHAPLDLFPYLGHREGKAELIETMEAVRRDFEILSYHPVIIVAEGENAAGLIDVRLRQRKTDRVIRIMLGHFMRFKNARIVEFREFTDSYDAAEQVLGHDLRH